MCKCKCKVNDSRKRKRQRIGENKDTMAQRLADASDKTLEECKGLPIADIHDALRERNLPGRRKLEVDEATKVEYDGRAADKVERAQNKRAAAASASSAAASARAASATSFASSASGLLWVELKEKGAPEKGASVEKEVFEAGAALRMVATLHHSSAAAEKYGGTVGYYSTLLLLCKLLHITPYMCATPYIYTTPYSHHVCLSVCPAV